jgi:hypothetical protein
LCGCFLTLISNHHRLDEFPVVRGHDARRRRRRRISAAKKHDLFFFFSLVGGGGNNKRDDTFASRFCATKSTTNKDEYEQKKISENESHRLRMVRIDGAFDFLQQNLNARREQVSIADISDVHAHVRGVRVLRDCAEFQRAEFSRRCV